MTRAEMKCKAKSFLQGNWGWSVGIAFVYWVATSILGAANRYTQSYDSLFAELLALIMTVVVAMLGISWQYTALALVDGDKEQANFNGILSVFENKRFGTSFVSWLLIVIFVILWSILLIIPGIIKLVAYSQTFMIIKDKMDAGEKISASEAITESRKLMNGHKMDFFVLQLSFLGWWILDLITLGIAGLWVMPYTYTTNAQFYRQLAGDRYRTTDKPEEKDSDEAVFTE